MTRKLMFAFFVAILLVGTSLLVLREKEQIAETSHTPGANLAIVSDSGRHEFAVELAVTPDDRARGLMFRREMAATAGMLFDFGRGHGRASMWMKNTYIPLDMVFIREGGEIESIAKRTIPESLETINSRGAVRAVLELYGGTTERLGIKPGDRVLHPIFGNAE